MTNLDRSRIELTESQLLTIKDRIKSWSTKDQVIDIMRYRYGRLEDQPSYETSKSIRNYELSIISISKTDIQMNNYINHLISYN
jgi:hypothetical protein